MLDNKEMDNSKVKDYLSGRNALVFFVCNDHSAVEVALELLKQGSKVTALLCDQTTGICLRNPYGNRVQCKFCNYSHKKVYRSYLGKNVKFYNLHDIVGEKDKLESLSFQMEFSSVSDQKKIEFHGVEIGYGAFSDFASLTRNIMPDISEEYKAYEKSVILSEVKVISAVERFVKESNFDLIVFHNGRFAFVKPFLGVAREYGIDYITTEHFCRGDRAYKNFFYNDVPHSIEGNIEKARQLWETMDPTKRHAIGTSFYEKRRHGIAAGDKVYTKEQVDNMLPEDWSEDVENIAIFNSSEDEFCAISKEYDKKTLFPNQFEALHAIFDHYKDDKTKHFYLRIHPNLKTVRFKSHLALYNLHYSNVTILPPESPISSYTLMDKSQKVLVFNSTMGLESAYWNKPVIALTKFYSTELGLAYSCENKDDLWALIDNKNLIPLKNDNAILMGNYFLRQEPPYVNIEARKKKRRVFSKTLDNITISQVWGSYSLYDLIQYGFSNNLPLFRLTSKFHRIPESTPLKTNGE